MFWLKHIFHSLAMMGSYQNIQKRNVTCFPIVIWSWCCLMPCSLAKKGSSLLCFVETIPNKTFWQLTVTNQLMNLTKAFSNWSYTRWNNKTKVSPKYPVVRAEEDLKDLRGVNLIFPNKVTQFLTPLSQLCKYNRVVMVSHKKCTLQKKKAALPNWFYSSSKSIFVNSARFYVNFVIFFSLFIIF